MHRSVAVKQIDTKLVSQLKENPSSFGAFIEQNNDGIVVVVLEKFGRINNKKTQSILLELLNSPNEKIRTLAIKNLAKVKDTTLIPIFFNYAKADTNTNVRREAVSALGRMRDTHTVDYLTELLSDKDPKIVTQAIRGLLHFTEDKNVKKALMVLKDHPNEVIKELIHSKLSTSSKKKNSEIKELKTYKYLNNKVICGDVNEILRYIPTESIDLTFTSPPYYNARDYSIYQSYQEYLKFMERVFKRIHRATKEGRFFILNTSPVIVPRISRAHSSKRYPIPFDIHPLLIKMGWEYIDDIIWLKPEASVKNRNAGFYQHRKPLGYKPNAVTEMLMVYRKKTDKLIDWNIKQYDSKTVSKSKVKGEYETTNVWQIKPKFSKNHSAVFPIELCNRVIQLYSYVGDLIFDPFGGSGTLGFAAAGLERNFLLAEKDLKYFDFIKHNWEGKENLFSETQMPDFFDLDSFIEISKQHRKESGED